MLDLETKGALAIQRRVPGAVTIFVKAPRSPSSSGGCASGRPRAPGEIDSGSRSREQQLSKRDEFDHVIVNDDLDRAVDELAGDRPRRLAAAGTMAS